MTLKYKVIYDSVIVELDSLDESMAYAKTLNKFVTIKGDKFEVCGIFGVDSVVNGKCPDGVAYDWNKASRIGRVKNKSI